MERNANQWKRYAKLQTDDFFFLDALKEPDVDAGDEKAVMYRLNMAGSTAKVYQVIVHTDRTFFCNCPDGTSHAIRLGVACKHVCFIAQRVLRLDFERDVYANSYVIAEATWPGIVDRLDKLAHGEVDQAVTHEELTARWRAIQAAAGHAHPVHAETQTQAQTQAPTLDEDAQWTSILASLDMLTDDDICAICYAEFVPEHPVTRMVARQLQQCATCHKYVHNKCMAKWISMGRSACVNCTLAWRAVEVAPTAVAAPVQQPAPKRRRTNDIAAERTYVNLGP